MKASPLDLNKIEQHFPVAGSPKLDGIRGIIHNGQVLSNSLKVFPNVFIQQWAKDNADKLQGLDGELIVGDPTDPNVFNNTTGPVRAIASKPDFRFHVFDRWNTGEDNFAKRHEDLVWSLVQRDYAIPRVQIVHHTDLNNMDELLSYEQEQLLLGYEGIMLRNLTTPYKFGRSTASGGELVKVKRFVDTEAEVIGFQELYSNQNEATKNEMGNTARSSHKENKVPMDTLGALIVKGKFKNGFEYTVNIGTGFTAEQRQNFWNNRAKYLGEFVKFKYQEIGTQEAPRTPVFLGWRMKEDM